MGYKSETQSKNIAWFLPRPKKDRYKGGMPLYCEEWLIELAKDILKKREIKLLNVFCGMNKYGLRVDLKEEVNPDIVCDIHKISKIIKDKFDVILADPPYSDLESKELYNTPKLNYKKWSAECDKLLKVGGLFIVYHKYIMPNPNPDKYKVVKRVFVGNRTYHLPRVAIYFRKIKKKKLKCRCFINAKYYSKVVSSGKGTLKGFKPCPIHDTEKEIEISRNILKILK